MKERIQALGTLVSEASAKLRRLDKENTALKLQVKALSSEVEKLRENQTELRKLRNWKDSAQSRLKKLSDKIDSAIKKAENL